MNRLQILDDFGKYFDPIKTKKTVLYGTGEATQIVVEGKPDFNIIGLLDGNHSGEVYYGKKVLDFSEAVKLGAEVVIIMANLSVAKVIFERIKDDSERFGIEVYKMNGLSAKDACESDTKTFEGTFNALPFELSRIVGRYDVVSFDLFDTLLVRKELSFERVFENVRDFCDLPDDFVERRKAAEKILYRNYDRWYNEKDIYNLLKEQYGWTEDEKNEYMKAECLEELYQASPRTEMIDFLNCCASLGKKVVITTDMYLSRDVLDKMIEKIVGAIPDVLLSNEQKASKYLGTLYNVLKEKYPGQIIHIGDNSLTDGQKAKENGVDSVVIPPASSLSFWETSNKRTIVKDIFSSGLVRKGNFKNQVFQIGSARDIGYLFWGPLTLGYLTGLYREAQKHIHGKVLFLARDGYLMIEIFKKLQEKYGVVTDSVQYLYASRRYLGKACAFNRENALFVLNDMCERTNISISYLLSEIYGIKPGNNEFESRSIAEIGKEDVWRYIEEKYADRIYENAFSEREKYMSYLKSLGLVDGDEIAIVNLVGQGISQKCLELITGKSLAGCYMALQSESESVIPTSKKFAWYDEPVSLHTSRSNLAMLCLQTEKILSAPYGSFAGFDENGMLLFEKHDVEKDGFMLEAQAGVMEYVDDMLHFCKNVPVIEQGEADEILGLIMNPRINTGEILSKAFEHDDSFGKTK